jgi:hypothetical protein
MGLLVLTGPLTVFWSATLFVSVSSSATHPAAAPPSPAILVGHSYGGTLITAAGTDPNAMRPCPLCSQGDRDRAAAQYVAKGHLLTLGAGVSGGPSIPQIADEHRAVEARQAIDPYTNKPETMTFNYCCFAIDPTTASWSRIQGGH